MNKALGPKTTELAPLKVNISNRSVELSPQRQEADTTGKAGISTKNVIYENS
ncbi:hypothetical protein OAL43_02075 [bacterium]|nr:hypothetical protein [Rubripirellula sp.]MDB4338615.1 hypothetical protein [Rubripirellula sp.]MDC0278970.1 hypothetical protein [bacterium]